MNLTQYKDKVVQAGLSEEATRVLLGLEFQVHGEEAYIDSLSIARELGIEHHNLLKVIRKFVEDQENLTSKSLLMRNAIIETTYLNNRNQSQPLFLLNEKAALRIIMKSNSKNADRIQDIIAEGFLILRDILTQPSLSPLEMMRNQLDLMIQQEKEIKALQAKAEATDYKLKATDTKVEATNNQVLQLANDVTELKGGLGYVTVVGYATRIKKSLDKSTAAKLGKACTKLCKDRGLKKSEVNDERYGIVGSYPNEVVKEVFDAYYLIN